MTVMVYTEEEHIPVCKIIVRDNNQENLLEFKNHRTGTCERMRLTDFIRLLLPPTS